MLTQLLSFQPPWPSCVSCLQAKRPDEKVKILMTRRLITPACVFITIVFSSTTSTWREVKGSHFLMKQKQQAACDLWTVTHGFRDQASSWEHWGTWFMSWTSTPLLIIHHVHLSGCGTQAEKPYFRHLAIARKKKSRKLAGAFCSSFWDACACQSILFHAIGSCCSSLL